MSQQKMSRLRRSTDQNDKEKKNTQHRDKEMKNKTDKEGRKRPKQWLVCINNKEEYRVPTLHDAAEALTTYYNCPYVKFTKDVVYNIRIGRNDSRHRHIKIVPVTTEQS